MSWFGSNSNPNIPSFNAEREMYDIDLFIYIARMKIEAEGSVDMMSQSCWRKCILKLKDNDLDVAEMSCIDRCVLKYIQSQKYTLQKMQEMQMQNQSTI